MSIQQSAVAQPVEGSWLQRQSARWKRDATYLVREARTLMLALKHPGVPWRAKLSAGCAAAYILSPIQLIPTFIPVIGQMDDLLALYLGMKAIRKFTAPAVLAECEEQAQFAFFVKRSRRSLASPANSELLNQEISPQ